MATIVLLCATSLILMRGVSGPSKVERTPDGSCGEVNAIKAEFSFGLHVLPVSLLASAEEKYRACAAKQENVDTAVARLLHFGTVNEHAEVVLFVGANQPLPDKSGFKSPLSTAEMKARGFDGFYTIAGDDTQRPMNRLHSMFNRTWASLTAIVLCDKGRLKFKRHLRAWEFWPTSGGESV